VSHLKNPHQSFLLSIQRKTGRWPTTVVCVAYYTTLLLPLARASLCSQSVTAFVNIIYITHASQCDFEIIWHFNQVTSVKYRTNRLLVCFAVWPTRWYRSLLTVLLYIGVKHMWQSYRLISTHLVKLQQHN